MISIYGITSPSDCKMYCIAVQVCHQTLYQDTETDLHSATKGTVSEQLFYNASYIVVNGFSQ